MGIKLELLLVILIAAMISVAYTVKLSDDVSGKQISKKEMEFTYTTFTEVDTEKLISTSFGTYGIRKGGVLTINDLVYHTDAIERLSSNIGRYAGEKVYFDGNIRMRQKEGFNYKAEHAVYNKKTGILSITSKFTAEMDENIVYGSSAVYDTRRKVLSAKEVDAVVYTAEK